MDTVINARETKLIDHDQDHQTRVSVVAITFIQEAQMRIYDLNLQDELSYASEMVKKKRLSGVNTSCNKYIEERQKSMQTIKTLNRLRKSVESSKKCKTILDITI